MLSSKKENDHPSFQLHKKAMVDKTQTKIHLLEISLHINTHFSPFFKPVKEKESVEVEDKDTEINGSSTNELGEDSGSFCPYTTSIKPHLFLYIPGIFIMIGGKFRMDSKE